MGKHFEFMSIKILLWNVHGVNDKDKRKVIKAMVKSYKVDVMCL